MNFKSSLIVYIALILFPGFFSQVIATPFERPSIEFNGDTFYFSGLTHKTDKVNELYLLKGETVDNYSKKIMRIDFFSAPDPATTAKSMVWDFQDDNKHIPFLIERKNETSFLLISFWWAIRPILYDQYLYYFKQDPKTHRVMAYVYIQRQFNPDPSYDHKTLANRKQSLLLDKKFLDKIQKLNF